MLNMLCVFYSKLETIIIMQIRAQTAQTMKTEANAASWKIFEFLKSMLIP